MHRLPIALSLFFAFSWFAQPISAQPAGPSRTVGIRMERLVSETTPITDKATGKAISYEVYQQRMKADPYAYHLEPIYNEYGSPAAYTIRPTTPEEHDTHQFQERNPDNRPKVGEAIPLFSMKDINGAVYRSTELKGRVVVLSFWISMRKPFWGPQQAKAFADAIRPYQSATGLVALGVLQDSAEDVSKVMVTETLPFVPVPNAYGFHKKFEVFALPSFIVLDKAGSVAAFIDGADYKELSSVLTRVSR